MKLKIKEKLFFSFLTICFFSLLYALVSLWLYSKKDRMSEQLKLLDDVRLLWMEEYKIQQEFLIFDTNNNNFFKSGKSEKLEAHKLVFAEIIDKLNRMNDDETSQRLFDSHFIQNILIELNNYQNIFSNVVTEIKSRGYKDFGIEGEMRNYAHNLMNIHAIDQVNILMLRRHEKDFIIRKEDQYVDKFKTLIKEIKSQLNHNNYLSTQEKIKIDSIINGYSSAFSKLVNAEKLLLGSNEQQGEITQLSKKHDFIVTKINAQKSNAIISEKQISRDLLFIAIVSMLLIFALGFLFSYKLASQFSKPIIQLNNSINRFVESKFSVMGEMEKRKAKDELTELSSNFYKMADEIIGYFKFFEEKVSARTAEIQQQHKEILEQKTMINEQYNELKIKTEAIKIHQKLVIEKNKNILASLRYAERIQKAIMPSKAMLKNMLPTSFIYFQPRDIVSGDFYFLHQKKNKIFFAVADCTGHGVPGAFVSIIGIHALHRALNEFNLEQPDLILNKVNELVEQNLSNYGDTIINDGMDIAFCCLDIEKQQLEYSGANIPLWIIGERNQIANYSEAEEKADHIAIEVNSTHYIKEIKANKQPIGYFQKRIAFTNHSIELKSGDSIYLFSDGFADQFGGPDGKKFKYDKLKNLLLSVQHYPIDRQKALIKDAHLSWKGDFEQVDDICVFGFKI